MVTEMNNFQKASWHIGVACLCTMIVLGLPAVQASARERIGSDSGSAGKTAEIKFEVISIRPVKSGWSPYDGGLPSLSNADPTPTGFTSTLTVWQMLMIAYAPDKRSAWSSIPIVNMPGWLSSPDWYVINARVAESDVGVWRKQSNHHEFLSLAMQDLLKKRCRLVIHEEPAELPDLKLVIAKKGLKIKAAVPGAAPPTKGMSLPSGGVRVAESNRTIRAWHFYGATIEDLVDFLDLSSPNCPIHDATGLTGHYDFAIQMIATPSRVLEDEIYNWPVEALGFQLKSGKYPGVKLVIDHIEKPSSND
jgi:uncharacterized protein (TIGR03435 family)